MRKSRNTWSALWVMGSVLALTSCGSSDDNGGDGVGSEGGTVTEQWASFCTGVFSQDTPIMDAFGDAAFTAKAGDEFLLSDFSDSSGGRAEFLYLTNAGPDSFTLEPSADGTWPFTSNCAINEGVPYYGVFKDVSVFADQELTMKICDLSAGSVLPAGSSGRGFAFAGSAENAAIYEVILGPFSAECEDQPNGYVSVPLTTSFGGSSTFLVPISGLIGPE